MRKFGLTVLLILASAALTRAQQDCTCVWPYKPESCWGPCTAALLAKADKNELRLIIGLPKAVADKITSWSGRETATSLKEYKKAGRLTSDEFDVVKKQLETLSEDQVEYFRKPAAERQAIRDQIQVLMSLKPDEP